MRIITLRSWIKDTSNKLLCALYIIKKLVPDPVIFVQRYNTDTLINFQILQLVNVKHILNLLSSLSPIILK